MNRYPAWLNVLVLSILLLGILLALPNFYGSVPAVQMVSADGVAFTESNIDEIFAGLESDGVVPEVAYLLDGRVVIRFHNVADQLQAGELLREKYDESASVALTLAPKLPEWVRSIGLSPMSLGLDLRGGVYFLLEVDMDAAIEKRLSLYEQSFSELLRDEDIRSRVCISSAAKLSAIETTTPPIFTTPK